jgi:hypothetical protein
MSNIKRLTDTRTGRALAVALPLAAGLAAPAMAQDDLAALRREMQQMHQQYDAQLKRLQQQYEAQLKAMETWVEAAEKSAADAKTQAGAAQQAAATAHQQVPAAAAPAAAAETAAPSGLAASAASFNPAIGAVLNGVAMASNHNPDNWRVPGVFLGSDAKPPPRGISIGESEVNFSANADQAVYGNLTLAFQRDNSVGVEEGFLQTTSLPYGLTVKAGRFFSGIGYLNEQHSHVWDFVDQPLPYMAFLNTQYDDDGVQVRWLAPAPIFVEFGGEVMRGDVFPAGGTNNHNAGIGAWSSFVHVGDDIGDSASYRVGLSHLWTSANNRQTPALSGGTDAFTGTDHTYILDATYKWAPNGNFVQTYLKLQAEFLLRQESGFFTPPGGPPSLRYSSNPQTGFYVQSVYQFMPQWRTGLRYDQLHAPNLGAAFAGTTLDNLNATARRYAAMIDYSPSEFSRFRLQYNLDKSRPGTDNQLILQYILSLGAHGAHQY